MLEFLSPAVFAAVVRVSSSPVFFSLLATASQLAWRVAADETVKESALAAILHLNSVHEGSPMSDEAPFMLKSITDMRLTPDGQYLLIHGDQPTAALHRSVLDDLLVALPNAIEHAERLIHKDRKMGFALQCQSQYCRP